jgi:hypothetical protein
LWGIAWLEVGVCPRNKEETASVLGTEIYPKTTAMANQLCAMKVSLHDVTLVISQILAHCWLFD